MDFRGLQYALLDTGKLAGAAPFCGGTASVFGWLLAYYQIPKTILEDVQAWNMGLTMIGFVIAMCSWTVRPRPSCEARRRSARRQVFAV